MSNIDSIKRAARKEAWYGESYNPFRKVKRSSTWSTQRDEEQAVGTTGTKLSQVQTEPLPESPRHDGPVDDTLLTMAATEPTMTTARTSEPGSGTTTAEKESESIPAPSERTVTQVTQDEGKPRNRFMKNFMHQNTEETEKPSTGGDEVEEKRPWYKGKKLYHAEPFTVRNQLQRTIFNSWVNILLLAAPVGIAINYAGIDGKIVFVVNFIAIIPLAGMLSFATEEIALHVGESLGGLLNASFGYVFYLLHSCFGMRRVSLEIVGSF
jgi:Ca2+:H+ antiporter